MGLAEDAQGADGKKLVAGKRVTGFANSEEQGVHITDVVPFLVEDMLKENGGVYEKGADWSSYVVRDGTLVTGQNPASSAAPTRRARSTATVTPP